MLWEKRSVIDWLGTLFVWATVAGCVVLWTFIISLAGLLWTHLRFRANGMDREAHLLAHPLPPDHQLPHAVVQIPAFNEGRIVERAIAYATRLDWPRDKLHIQVCDDSTDSTTEFAQAAAEKARASGVDVTVFHRTDRAGFKAGALSAAQAVTEHEFFAVLDVDFTPHPNFLRRCMPVLMAERDIGFVQARPDFFNASENALTRGQALILDFHYGLEQPTRCWSGLGLPFNGTGGIWRREAIRAAGGWCGDTLTEDMDLAYQALLAGWRGFYVVTVPVSGELPTNLRAWTAQQRRWLAGNGEVAWKNLPALASVSGMSMVDRLRASQPLLGWFGYVFSAGTFFLTVPAIALKPSLSLALLVLVSYLGIAAMLFALMRTANRFLGRKTRSSSFAADFAVALTLCAYISWAALRSVPATISGRRRVFERTPKKGSAPDSFQEQD